MPILHGHNLNTCFGGNGLLQNQYISYLLDSRRVDGMKIACEKIYPEWPPLYYIFKSGRPVAKKPNLLSGAVAIFKRKRLAIDGVVSWEWEVFDIQFIIT